MLELQLVLLMLVSPSAVMSVMHLAQLLELQTEPQFATVHTYSSQQRPRDVVAAVGVATGAAGVGVAVDTVGQLGRSWSGRWSGGGREDGSPYARKQTTLSNMASQGVNCAWSFHVSFHVT